jgi:serine/threonine protein kinase
MCFVALRAVDARLHCDCDWRACLHNAGSRLRMRMHCTRRRILYELAQALQHLHSKRIIHRDIKIGNVLLDESNRVKLGDLGVSRALDGEEELAQSRVGTPLYLAPELIKRQAYDYKADIWALGVLIYHMSALKGPFSGDNIYALGYSILNDTPPQLPGIYSKPLTRLIMTMLDKVPDRRPSVDDIMSKLPTRMPAELQAKGPDSASGDAKLHSEADAASMLTTAAATASDSISHTHTHASQPQRPVEIRLLTAKDHHNKLLPRSQVGLAHMSLARRT